MLFDRKRTLRTGLAACLLALGSLATAAHKAQDTPVAWVNGQPVQRTTLVELLNQRAGAAAAAAPGRPLAPVTLADRQRALDDIIQMELLMQRAEAEGLTRHPLARAELEFQRDQVLGQRLLRLLAQETQADESEVAARHREMKTEHQVSARHILLRDEAAAREAIARLQGGAEFKALARALSLDKDTREHGGLLPPSDASAFVPAFAEATITLAPGEYTRTPVQTDSGWHVILLESRKSTEPPSLDAAREWLAPRIVQEKVDAQVAAWREAAEVKLLQPLDDKPLEDVSGDVASIDGRPVARAKLEQLVLARNGIEGPSPSAAKAATRIVGRESTLDELVMVELLAHKARERGLDKNPSVMAEAELQAKTAAGRMYVRHLIARTQVKPAELQAVYRTDVPPHDFKLSQIVVADEAQARELIAELGRGKDFAALAREHSIDEGTRPLGGSLDWRAVHEMKPEVATVVRKLKPGRHAAAPVHTDIGWHVVRLDARRTSAKRPDLKEASAWLVPKLLHDKVQAHLTTLRAQADVKLMQ
ncbi:MAG: peptidylprolyl isomerase [Rhizobacter sp.]